LTQSSLPSRWIITSPNFANDPDIFPLLPGFSFITSKEPTWQTGVQQASSGRERRRMQWSYPVWSFNVGYEVLRDAPSLAEQQKLLAFFNSKAGRYQEFFFFDPSDNSVFQTFGTGDGTTTTFQLTRTVGGGAYYFVEPIRCVMGTPTVRVNGVMVGAPIGKNLARWSEDFSNAVWAKDTGITVGANTDTAPDGTTTADTVTDTSTSVVGSIYQNITVANDGTAYVGSVYVQKATSAVNQMVLAIGLYGGSPNPSAVLYFDPYFGTIQSAAPSGKYGIEDHGAFWRVWVSATNNNAGNTSLQLAFYPAYGPYNVLGSSAAANTGSARLWGAQAEVGTSPSAYVPTTSTAGDYSIGPLGQITFFAAPASGAALTFLGNFAFLVRFADDKLTAKQLMNGLWSADGINLIGVKA